VCRKDGENKQIGVGVCINWICSWWLMPAEFVLTEW
jgi:hypothetical protein